MPNNTETDTGSSSSGQQGQGQAQGLQPPPGQMGPPVPAWMQNPQQMAIFANYQKLGFDGHMLHAMNTFANGGNDGTGQHLKAVFGSVPDLEMTAWLDQEQTRKDQAEQQATMGQQTLTPQGGALPPPNPREAQQREGAQASVDQRRKAGMTPPAVSLAQQQHARAMAEMEALKARYTQSQEDPVMKELQGNIDMVPEGQPGQPINSTGGSGGIPINRFPASMQRELEALYHQQFHGRPVSVDTTFQNKWSPALQQRLAQILQQGQQERDTIERQRHPQQER